jgi:hypothetical protein
VEISGGKEVKLKSKSRVPVLLLSLACGFGVLIYYYLFILCELKVPFFGVLLQGYPAKSLVITYIVGLTISAWGLYRLKPWSFYLVSILILAKGASFLVTFCCINIMDYMSEIGFSTQGYYDMGWGKYLGGQPPFLNQVNIYILGSTLVFLGYVALLKKFYK